MERYLEHLISKQQIYVNTYIYTPPLKKTIFVKTDIQSKSGKIYILQC